MILVVVMLAACGGDDGADGDPHEIVDCSWNQTASRCERACSSAPSGGTDTNGDGRDDTCVAAGVQCPKANATVVDGQRGCCFVDTVSVPAQVKYLECE